MTETKLLEDRVTVMKSVIEQTRDADTDLFAFRLVSELEKLDHNKTVRQDRQDRVRAMAEGIAQGIRTSIFVACGFIGVGLAGSAGISAYVETQDAYKRGTADGGAAAEQVCYEKVQQLASSFKHTLEGAESKLSACQADKATIKESVDKIVAVCMPAAP